MSHAVAKLFVVGDVRGKHVYLSKLVAKASAQAGPFDAVLCVGQVRQTTPFLCQLLKSFALRSPTVLRGGYGWRPTAIVHQRRGQVRGTCVLHRRERGGGERLVQNMLWRPLVLTKPAYQAHTHHIDGIPDGGELCPNLTYLGRQGRKVVGGLSVCYLSGRFDAAEYEAAKGDDETAPDTRATKYSSAYTRDDVEELLISGGAYRKVGGSFTVRLAECVLTPSAWAARVQGARLIDSPVACRN